MRHAHLLRPGLQNFSLYGSNETTGEAEWMTTLTPQDIVDMLVENEQTSDDENGYSRDPNKRTGGNRRTGKKLDQELINVQEVINVQGRKTSLIK